MSFDVSFWPRDGVAFDLNAVRTWLGAAPNWTLQKKSALYENDVTGVYFVLDLNEPGRKQVKPPLMALINVYRPSFFGMECAEVLADLTSRFALLARDEQEDQDARVEFSPEWFVPRWNASNVAGYRAIGTRDSAPNGMPQSTLIAAWTWNRHREELHRDLAIDIFVPKIMPLLVATGPATTIVWTDAIPVAMPLVRFVIIYRNQLAVGRKSRNSSELVLQTRADVIHALGEFAIERDERVDFIAQPPPASVTDWVRSLPITTSGMNILRWDQVHDAELLVR